MENLVGSNACQLGQNQYIWAILNSKTPVAKSFESASQDQDNPNFKENQHEWQRDQNWSHSEGYLIQMHQFFSIQIY